MGTGQTTPSTPFLHVIPLPTPLLGKATHLHGFDRGLAADVGPSELFVVQN